MRMPFVVKVRTLQTAAKGFEEIDSNLDQLGTQESIRKEVMLPKHEAILYKRYI